MKNIIRFFFKFPVIFLASLPVVWFISELIKHPQTSTQSDFGISSWEEVALLAGVTAYYFYVILGWGIIINRIFGRLSTFLRFLVFGFLFAISFYTYVNTPVIKEYGNTANILLVFVVLAISFTSALVPVVKILFGIISKIHLSDKANSRLSSFFRLAIVFVMVMLFVQNYNLDLRLSRLEKKFGNHRNLICDEQEAIKKVKMATVRIVGGESEGSGMLIRSDGIVITNAHVVTAEAAPKVVLPDYTFKTAEIIDLNNEADIAVLKIDGKNYPVVNLVDSEVLQFFDPLYVIGYPLGTNLKGDATVASGRFVARRTEKNMQGGYIQIDGAINPGNSGGPIITSCGEAVGMATAGISGLGLALTSESILSRTTFLNDTYQPLPKVETVKLEPDKGPKEVVEAFYTYVKMRQLDKAYKLISNKRIKDIAFKDWQNGYANTIDVTPIEVKLVDGSQNRVFVKIASKDLVNEEVVVKYFEGEWEVIKENNSYRLGDSEVYEVKEPSWNWFWDLTKIY